MTFPRINPGSILPGLDDAQDWLNAAIVRGTGRADELAVTGTGKLILGFGGNDTITSEGSPGAELGNAIFGGGGKDEITAYGARNLISGGSGDDAITFGFGAGPAEYNRGYGGSGDDTLAAYGSFNTLYGGTGDDSLTISGQRVRDGNAYGGAGKDALNGDGFNIRLHGGSGDDQLTGRSSSISTDATVDAGVIFTGGSGRDSFTATSSTLLLAQGDTNGLVSAGDVISGVLNVITDYEAGERIDIDAGSRQTGPVRLVDPETGPPDRLSPELAAGRYAEFHGELTAAGRFTVGDEGPDLLLLYNGSGDDPSLARGALVLQDWSGDVLIA